LKIRISKLCKDIKYLFYTAMEKEHILSELKKIEYQTAQKTKNKRKYMITSLLYKIALIII
jgi:hypothetical protein